MDALGSPDMREPSRVHCAVVLIERIEAAPVARVAGAVVTFEDVNRATVAQLLATLVAMQLTIGGIGDCIISGQR